MHFSIRLTNAKTRGHKYVISKVCELDSPAIRRELAAYNHLATVTTKKPGGLLVRELLDSFKVLGPAGEYQCLIHEPLGMSMDTLRQLSPGRKLPESLLKVFLKHLLQALDFLHTDARMIHAGTVESRKVPPNTSQLGVLTSSPPVTARFASE